MRTLFFPLIFLVACEPEITKQQFDQALKSQKEQMDKQNKSIKRVVRTQGDTIRQLKALLAEPIVDGVVSKLAAASGDAIVVSSVSVAANAGKKIEITGNASDKKKIAGFISALEKHAMIEKVYLATVTETEVAEEQRQSFEITAKYVAVAAKKKSSSSKKTASSKKKDALKKKSVAKKKKTSASKGKNTAPVKKASNENK